MTLLEAGGEGEKEWATPGDRGTAALKWSNVPTS